MYDDDEFDEDWADSDDDSTLTVRCASCGEDAYAEADSCPYCGEFLIADSDPLSGKPAWFVWLGLIGIVAVLLALSGALSFL